MKTTSAVVLGLSFALLTPALAMQKGDVLYAVRVDDDNEVYVDVENATRLGIRITSVDVVFYDKRKKVLERSTVPCRTDCLVAEDDEESFGPIEAPRGWQTVEVTEVRYEDDADEGADNARREIESDPPGPPGRPSPPDPGIETPPPPPPAPLREGRRESVEGYSEWWRNGVLIVDGQRVRLVAGGKLKVPKNVKEFNQIPLGYEVKAKGRRGPDGMLLADEVEAKENGVALFETDLRSAFDAMEQKYLTERRMYEEGEDGNREEYGRLYTSGPQVERLRRILGRLVPDYLAQRDFRVYVVENREWNAMAAPNDSMYVFSGLLDDMDDDEVAIVLGHELAHATHEHSRKSFKKDLFIQLAAAGVAVIAEEAVDDENKRAALQLAALLGANAWSNGYGRSHEDQADRVGLRYANEGGFDVRKGPRLWNRFAEKYGDSPKVLNFFFGDHSVAQDRARNLTRELALNYSR